MSRLKWLFLILLRYYRNLGLRVSLYALLSLVAALLSPLVQPFMGETDTNGMTFESVIPILSILATSMLAVSTFSLNIMVSAYRAAAASTTPRVYRILLEDTTTQSVLSTFIGAFVYSLSSIILYRANFYTENSALLVMGVTIFVVVLVVLALLRWVQHLTTLGSVDDSLRAVCIRTADALSTLAKTPTLGASPSTEETVVPSDCTSLCAPSSGYIQLIDIARLEELMPPPTCLYINFRPGTHVLRGQTIALASGSVDPDHLKDLSKCFKIGNERSFEQDAGYGLVVLSEIASKALSPGINDSGTAIATTHSIKKLLWEYAHRTEDEEPICARRVFLPKVDHKALLEAAFIPIARDGSGNIEIAMHLRQALAELAQCGQEDLEDAVRHAARVTLRYFETGNLLEEDFERLRRMDI